MLSSSSSYGGIYEEALTSQPRSSKSVPTSSAGMDLSYVTERIIALWFPGSVSQQAYRHEQRQAAHMLKNKHGNNYMVRDEITYARLRVCSFVCLLFCVCVVFQLFNLSEPKRTLRNEHKHVKEVGWAPKLAPPLEKICSVCKEIDKWLSADQHHIAVIHVR